MCVKEPKQAAKQLLEEVAAGGERARVAAAAFFLPDYPCAARPAGDDFAPTLVQFISLPEMHDAQAVMQ